MLHDQACGEDRASEDQTKKTRKGDGNQETGKGPACINLREQFPGYRIKFDAAAESRKEKADPWMQQMPCKFGVIYPFGGNRLAIEVDYHATIARRLTALGLHLYQDGDDEKTFFFTVDQFEAVAAIVRPKKKRVNQTSRENLLANLRQPPRRHLSISEAHLHSD